MTTPVENAAHTADKHARISFYPTDRFTIGCSGTEQSHFTSRLPVPQPSLGRHRDTLSGLLLRLQRKHFSCLKAECNQMRQDARGFPAVGEGL